MTLPAVTRATIRITGNPFPVGGRLAACSDMEAMGLTPVRSAKDRERSKRQAQDCEPYPGESPCCQNVPAAGDLRLEMSEDRADTGRRVRTAMSETKITSTPDTVPVATIQVGVVPTAPKSVSSPNSTRNALLLASDRR